MYSLSSQLETGLLHSRAGSWLSIHFTAPDCHKDPETGAARPHSLFLESASAEVVAQPCRYV